jgi:D-specific alpha-keto acid dehydrogenase
MLLSSPSSAVATTGITIYGCAPDEALLLARMAPRHGVLATVTEAGPVEGNVDLARGNRCVSIGHKTPVDNATLLALRRAGVRYVSTRSVGYNHVDRTYAAGIGITVENVAYSPDSVADYTLMLMLMAVRNAKAVLRRADARDYRLPDARGRELRDLTVGVVGTGRIGAAVVDRLQGFGSRVLAYDQRPGTGAGAEHRPLDELLRHSDVVTLHTPLDATTHHLLDRRRIERLKPGAVVVNTGRGALVDTHALVRALESGHLGGAALDVLEGEEGIFYADCGGGALDGTLLARLQALPNAIVSPHTAYYTDHALSDMVEGSITNCLEFENGNKS